MIGELLLFVLGFGAATGVAYTLRKRGLRRIARLQRENADLLGEESRIFTFLHDLGTSLGDDRGLRRLHEEIVEGMVRVAGAGGAVMYLVDSRTGTHFVPAAMTPHCPPLVEIPKELREQRSPQALHSYLQLRSVPLSHGILGKVFEGQGPINLGKLGNWEQVFPEMDPGQKELFVMAAPLSMGSRRMGVLAVAREGGPFSPHIFEVFRSAAEQVSFALVSAMVQQEAMDKRRMEEELRSASEVQRILLPRKAPEIGDYFISACNTPAKVLSGDYYDFIRIDDDHMGLVIADVSGKGFPASLVMATCRALLRGQAGGEASPSRALSKVNRMLFGDVREDMFISLAYCVLDRRSPQITLARAGHDAPLLFRRATGEVSPLKPPGLALGVDGGKVFERVTKDLSVEMSPGDCLLLYTDGVNEAVSADGDEFGIERLQETFRLSAPNGAQAVLEALQTALDSFVGGAPQADDITLLVVERR